MSRAFFECQQGRGIVAACRCAQDVAVRRGYRATGWSSSSPKRASSAKCVPQRRSPHRVDTRQCGQRPHAPRRAPAVSARRRSSRASRAAARGARCLDRQRSRLWSATARDAGSSKITARRSASSLSAVATTTGWLPLSATASRACNLRVAGSALRQTSERFLEQRHEGPRRIDPGDPALTGGHERRPCEQPRIVRAREPDCIGEGIVRPRPVAAAQAYSARSMHASQIERGSPSRSRAAAMASSSAAIAALRSP